MTVAIVFPGQGSQKTGMGKDFHESSAIYRETMAEADSALGYDVTALSLTGPDEKLNMTEFTQPALLAASYAMYRAVEEVLGKSCGTTAFFAGHSLGEYTAFVAAGAIKFADALRAVSERGKAMQAAVPPGVGGMAAIIGLSADKIVAVCAETESSAGAGKIVRAVNFNSPEQTVIAGHADAVNMAVEKLKSAGAKRCVPLAVSAPSHSPLMAPAAVRMRSVLDGLPMSAPRIPVVTNFTAGPVTDPSAAKDGLVSQIENPVRWVESVQRMASDGVSHFIEIGPGKVLTGLIKRIADKAVPLNIEDPASLEKTLAALNG